MADYFVGPVMEKIIDACFEYLKDQVTWQTGMKEELQRLRDIHPQIQDVVSVYSQAETKDPALNEWYWQLRDAIDAADDVLDEIEYWKLEKSVISKDKGKRRAEVPVWNIYENLKPSLRIGKSAPKSDPNLLRLEEAVKKLSKISAEVITFLHLLDRSNQEQLQQQLELYRKREAGAMPGNELLGRSEEIEFVRQWLRTPYQTKNTGTGLYKNISLLSVVGHGGMGKTTLLQHVFQDGVTEKFGVKMWVCVSNNFDSKKVIKNMLESLKEEKIYLETLGALQSRLLSEVKKQRFLLVLDDIWEEDDWKWENVLAPLQYGSLGSKILITTRLHSVATKFGKMIKEKEILSLKGLKEVEYLQLFNIHAFDGVESPDDEFRSIAGKIVEKLSGCPLSAKVIGGILNSYIDKSYWIKILNTIIEKVGSDSNQLLTILKLSYIYLPNVLQNCKTFCCIFPQDHEFDKEDLIRMWIAVGFFQSSNMTGETLEDTGRRYFNILVKKSFFHEFQSYKGYRGQVCYKMHDLLHEPQSVSAQECFRIVDDTTFSIPKTTRHLSINVNVISSLKVAFKNMGELKNLRSLFLSIPRFATSVAADDDENVVSEILKASKSIRLLVINYNFLRKIPDSIGCLIHLRYLKVKSNTSTFSRPIGHLYHLQFLIFLRLSLVESSNLEMTNIGWKESIPNENCQVIFDTLVIKDPTQLLMKSVRNCSVQSLEIMYNAVLVSFPSEAEQWFFHHHSSLFRLKFYKLPSLRSLPFSLKSFSSLETLEICHLKSFECLPSSLSTISSLNTLKLKDIRLLKSLPDLPSSLKILYLAGLESLQCLPSSLSTISSLNTLKLKDIRLLESLPDLPSSLTKLELTELESLQCLPSSLSTISSLKNLKLRNIRLLKSLPDLPSSLSSLILSTLENLDCLPSCLPTTLNRLWISKLPWLLEVPDLPASLTGLFIENCAPQLMECYLNFGRPEAMGRI